MKIVDKLLPVAGIALAGLVGWAWAEQDKVKYSQRDEVIAEAANLGCSYIEQSFKHPQNFYIDCGDGNIRIIKLENKYVGQN